MPVLLLLSLLLQRPAELQVPAFVAPTKSAPAITTDETAAIRKGIAFHDQKRYDEALAAYQAVLDGNADNTTALYELAYTYLAKKDYQRAIDLAARGTAYTNNAEFYVLIAQVVETSGDPKAAVTIYRKGIEFNPHAGTLFYNLAVTTESALHDHAASKQVLKEGASADPRHAATQLLLGRGFGGDGLRTLGLLALSRFLILEPATARTGQAYQAWYGSLNGGVSPSGSGNLNITVDPRSLQGSDEGQMTKLDLMISLSQAAAMKGAEGKSQAAVLADQVKQLLAVYAEQKPGDDSGTFLWTYYMPYFRELSQKGFAEVFVYYVSQRVNLQGVREWLTANPDQVKAFVTWDKAYAWPSR